MSVGRAISLWAPVVAFMTMVWVLSDRGGSELPVVVWDKLSHVGAYAVFGALVFRACHGGLRRPWRVGPALAAAALVLTYGVVDEWHQAHVPGRDPSVADWGADAVGLVSAWIGLRATNLLSARGATANSSRCCVTPRFRGR